MASVFSYFRVSFHYSSDHDDRLIHSSRASHCFYPSLPDDSRLQFDDRTDPPAHRSGGETTFLQRTSPLHGTAANDADVSMKKPRRSL